MSDWQKTTPDPGQIEQVIMNLALNARDAMPTGGKLLIRHALYPQTFHRQRHRKRKPNKY